MSKTQRAMTVLKALAADAVGVRGRSVAYPRAALQTWLRELAAEAPAPPLKGRVAVLAMRNRTWIEWAVYAACWMRKLGHAPVILYSRKDVERTVEGPGFANRLMSGGFWKLAARIPDVELVDLDAEPTPDAAAIASFTEFAASYAPTVSAYEQRLEEYEEGPGTRERYQRGVDEAKPRLAEFAARTHRALERLNTSGDLTRLVAYSGLIGMTSAAGEAAKRLGISSAFVEGWAIKPGHMIASVNAPAMTYNIRAWLQALGDWDQAKAAEIAKFLAFQETGDLAGADWLKTYHQFQRTSADAQLEQGLRAFLEADGPLFLLAPNCVGDSATLRVQTVFKSQREWLYGVCDHFRKHPDRRLVVRAHPDELFYFERNKIVIMLGDVAKEAASGAPNIRVITGKEDVSTYALIPYARAGLVWMSTVGADMAVRNCPVLAAATPKYHGLGIVHEPTTREEYFATLDRLATNPPRGTSDEQKEMAKKYLTILTKEFSYEAFGRDYMARDLHLAGHPAGGDFDTFYKILAGDLPPETRPPLRAKGGSA